MAVAAILNFGKMSVSVDGVDYCMTIQSNLKNKASDRHSQLKTILKGKGKAKCIYIAPLL